MLELIKQYSLKHAIELLYRCIFIIEALRV